MLNETKEKRRVLKAYTIVEKQGSPKGFWLNIGVASDNRDGSISVKLDALPINGLIQIREYDARKTENGHHSVDRNPPKEW